MTTKRITDWMRLDSDELKNLLSDYDESVIPDVFDTPSNELSRWMTVFGRNTMTPDKILFHLNEYLMTFPFVLTAVEIAWIDETYQFKFELEE